MKHEESKPAYETQAIPSQRWLFVVSLGLLSAIGPFTIDMYLPSLPVITGEMKAAPSLGQLSLTSCMLGLALGQLISGPISDRLGRKRPLIWAMAGYVMFSLLCAVSGSMELFILFRFIQGLSGAAGIVIARAIVRDLYSGNQLVRFFSRLMLINGAAPVLAPLAGAQILRFADWRGTFFVLGLFGMVLLSLVVFALPETLNRQSRSTGGFIKTLGHFRNLAANRAFIGYALIMSFVSAAMFAYISGSPFVIQEMYKVSPEGYSLLFATNGIGIILAAQLTGALIGRVSVHKLLQSGIGIALCGGIGLLLTALMDGGIFPVIVCLFMVVSSVGIVGTTTTSLAMQSISRDAGSASALLGMLQFIFGAAASPIVGVGGSGTAIPMAVVIAAAEITALCLYILIAPRGLSTCENQHA